MKLCANAKINLTLNITHKRNDGYHELKSIMYPIALCDEISIEENDFDIVTYNVPIENDIVIQAVKRMKEKYSVDQSVRIDITKHIPIQAGLGGGSSDAATVLRGLNEFWDLDIPIEQLDEVALSLGSDVVFCLHNKPALVKGIGEDVCFLPPVESYVLLVVPENGIETKVAFENLNSTLFEEKDITNHLIMIAKGQLHNLSQACFNDFHDVAQRLSEECYVLSRQLHQINPNFSLTGSGSTFFALYDSLEELREHEKIIQEMNYQTIHTTLLS